MKKKYIQPFAEVVKLNVRDKFLDEKLGNNTYVPVTNEEEAGGQGAKKHTDWDDEEEEEEEFEPCFKSYLWK